MPCENEANKSKVPESEIWDVLYKLVKMLADDIKNGFRPLIVCGISEDAMEEFDKKIMSRPEHHGETSGEARETEIRNFIFETIGKSTKKN